MWRHFHRHAQPIELEKWMHLAVKAWWCDFMIEHIKMTKPIKKNQQATPLVVALDENLGFQETDFCACSLWPMRCSKTKFYSVWMQRWFFLTFVKKNGLKSFLKPKVRRLIMQTMMTLVATFLKIIVWMKLL